MSNPTHFVSFSAAMFHYILKGYNAPRRAVSTSMRLGIISIGQPVLKPGQELLRVDDGRRYVVIDPHS